MPIHIERVDFHVLNMRTRMPFKYGIATLTALPHLFVRLAAVVDGRRQQGIAADGLPPKWFTKNPDTTVEHDLREMLEVIRHAAAIAVEVKEADTVFDLWQQVYTMQASWGRRAKLPALLWGLGPSLIERAAIDAFCRAKGVRFAAVLRSGELGTRLGDLLAELSAAQPADLLPPAPLRRIIARHTVGLADPITDADIPAAERVDDGLPQSLEACVEAYGLTHFKIKLSGDVQRDLSRLQAIAAITTARGKPAAFSLDGNEHFRAVAPLRQWWAAASNTPAVEPFMRGLLFVEQPLHRDVALSDEVGRELLAWRDRPPIIIDESDSDIDSAAKALELGYAGTSYKNCKGVFKGIANACLLEQRRRSTTPTGRRPPGETTTTGSPTGTALSGRCFFILSGEDLANVGPVALLQDLAAAATLGIEHIERNGHHYFRGLSMFPADIQQDVLAHHGDLYRRHESGFPTLDIRRGAIDVGSVVDAPFGMGITFDTARFVPLDDWRFESLTQ